MALQSNQNGCSHFPCWGLLWKMNDDDYYYIITIMITRFGQIIISIIWWFTSCCFAREPKKGIQ